MNNFQCSKDVRWTTLVQLCFRGLSIYELFFKTIVDMYILHCHLGYKHYPPSLFSQTKSQPEWIEGWLRSCLYQSKVVVRNIWRTSIVCTRYNIAQAYSMERPSLNYIREGMSIGMMTKCKNILCLIYPEYLLNSCCWHCIVHLLFKIASTVSWWLDWMLFQCGRDIWWRWNCGLNLFLYI